MGDHGEGAGVRGRDVELARLAEFAARLAHGKGASAVVVGEPGMGKTHLLDAVLADVPDAVQVFRAAAAELEHDRPFWLVAKALLLHGAADAGDRGRLVRALRGGGAASQSSSGELRWRIVEDVVGFVEELERRGPLLLVFEDLHWADPSSVLVCDQLQRRLSDRAVLLVFTRRPWPASHELDRLEDAAEAVVRLAPLPDPSVVDIAQDALGAAVGPRLIRQLSAAGGNPLFVVELLAALEEDDAITVEGGTAEIA